MFWVLIMACQAPFALDRHDLVGFRVAAVELHRDDVAQTIQPTVSVVVDGRPWSDERPGFDWYWLDAPEDLFVADPTGTLAASGPTPRIPTPTEPAILGLVARHGADEHRSFIRWSPELDDVPRPSGIVIEDVPLDATTIDEDSLALDGRRALETTPSNGAVDPSGFLRLRAQGLPDEVLVRWTSTRGTWFELDEQQADWTAADVIVDGLEVDEVTLLEDGPVTVIAIRRGEDAVSALATDLHIGDPGPFTVTSGRVLPGLALDGPAIVTLVADDNAPSGLSIADPEPHTGSPPPIACGEPVEGNFDPDWLLHAWCTRDELVGQRVLVVP